MRLADPLPLRTSVVWPGYRESTPLAHRYGSTGGALVQYDDTRRVFVWADHAVRAIDSVLIGGQPAGNWIWRNAPDSTGRTVAFVEFEESPDEGADVVAHGRGKLHPRTGQLLTNPGDLLWDILANVSGLDVTEGDIAEFRSDAARLGIVIAGSLGQRDPIRSIVRGVCASIGAIYSPSTPGLARFWPGGAGRVSVATAEARHNAQASWQLGDVVTGLRIEFDVQDGQSRQMIELRAPSAAHRFGERTANAIFDWVADARVAHAIGVRLLRQSARPQWLVSVSGIERVLSIGDTITLNHPALPVSGDAMVLAREADLEAVRSAVVVRVPVGDVPAVEIVRQTARSEVNAYAGASVQTVGGERVLTLQEEDSRPISSAQVTLDGQWTRQTDGAGRVAFPASLMPPGEHSLLIVTSDGRRLTTVVVVQ